MFDAQTARLQQMSFQRKYIQITPDYLLQLSQQVETLSQLQQMSSMTSLTNDFHALLADTFPKLNNNLYLYQKDPQMTQASIILCKSQLQMFCLQRLGSVLSKESKELSEVINWLSCNYHSYTLDLSKIILQQRNRHVVECNTEKDRVISNLRREASIKREYQKELESRVKQLEGQNSDIYHKLINNAKNTVDYTLNSPSKHKHSTANQSNSSFTDSLTKIKAEMSNAHKALSAKQAEEIIFDIMESKVRQQTVRGKHASMPTFLRTYFRYKFGMKELAQESEINFREAVVYYARTQEKNIFILFQCLLDEECEEAYFEEYKGIYERITRCIKRYMNEKEGIPFAELDRLFDTKIIDERADIVLTEDDVKHILINVYKNNDVESLQMIINEIIMDKIQGKLSAIPSKKLLNQLLNYELKKHTIKIEDIVRQTRAVDDTKRDYMTFEELSAVLLRLKIPTHKYEQFLKNYTVWQDKFFTRSEAIEAIEQIRSNKNSKKKNQ